MKILIVSDIATHPVTAGNRKWTLAQADILVRLGHEVHFLWVKNDFPGKKDYEETKCYWKNRFHYFHKPIGYKWRTLIINKYRRTFNHSYWKCDDHYPPFLIKKVNQLIKTYHFEVCIVNYYYLTKLFPNIDVPLKALFTHDCFSYKYLATNLKKSESLTATEEAKAMQRSPFIFALQDDESIFFQKLSPKSTVYTIYGWFDYIETPVVHNRNIVFLSGSNKFNLEGIQWFVDDIFPLIVEQYPDLKLCIGGSICDKLLSLSSHPNIQLFGLIDDVKAFYSLGDICINPVFNGTGLKIKTFEAMSYGKVVIVHPHSLCGIYKKEQAPLLAPNTAKKWKDCISQIFQDKELVEFYKMKDKEYLCEMNKFILAQYESFLNQKPKT